MKNLALAIAAFSLSASASVINHEGTFVSEHEVAMMSYQTKEACEADQGEWTEDLCIFHSQDDVTVKRANNGKLQVEMNTIHTNAHSCSFEGEVVSQEMFKLVAATESDEWDEEKQDFVKAVCEVTVTYSNDGNTVNASNNGKCRSFCGMNAVLEIEGAVRK